jgi:hypothetical protein
MKSRSSLAQAWSSVGTLPTNDRKTDFGCSSNQIAQSTYNEEGMFMAKLDIRHVRFLLPVAAP